MSVPDRRDYHPAIGAWMATGDAAVEAVDACPGNSVVALDTETAGLDNFTIKCVTAAWFLPDGAVESVLLDPRDNVQRAAVARLAGKAFALVLHNAPFDVPPLVHHGLIALEHVDKVTDTIVLARMAYPDTMVKKGLGALAHLAGYPDDGHTMATAFRAAGYRTAADGWRDMDVDSFVYRYGAMADTVVTLRLAPVLWDAAVAQLTRTDYPDVEAGGDRPRRILSPQEAEALVAREQIVSRVMLRRSARGLAVDTDYLARYRAEHEATQADHAAVLEAAGIDADAGNVGALMVEHLETIGELPADWPRTEKTGKLSASKTDLKALADHPLVAAQQALTETRKVLGYLDKVAAQAAVTGRVHPQVSILGASATGRMSYSDPELQQFPADARPIIVADDGDAWVSLDWKAIEPVVAALMARDEEFLTPFEEGADLYEPLTKAAGIDRKVAKTVLLGLLYGMGVAKLAATLGVTDDEALKIQRDVVKAMKPTAQFLLLARDTADRCRLATTAAGRMLDVPVDPKTGRVMSSKASNYIVQGTAYDVLADAIVRCEAAGLGDFIHLALHDELVVSAHAAEAVMEIMATPPSWLADWADRTPTIRVDRNDLGPHWAYV